MASTPMNVESASHTWTICNFRQVFETLKSGSNKDAISKESTSEVEYMSEEFMMGQLVGKTSKWQIELERFGGELSSSIRCIECFHPEVKIILGRFQFEIVDFMGNVLHSPISSTAYFDPKNISKFELEFKPEREGSSRQVRYVCWALDLIPMQKLEQNWNKYCTGNILNIRLRFHIYRDLPKTIKYTPDIREEIGWDTIPPSLAPMLDGIADLWNTMEGADLTIKSRDDETDFRAHKLILSVQNPVLKKMIKEASKPSEECVIIVDWHPPNVLKLLLRYFYDKNLKDVESCKDVAFLTSLFRISKEFEVKPLRRCCLNSLLRNLKLNFLETWKAILELDLSSEDSYLMREAKKILLINISEIQSNKEFQKWAAEKENREKFLRLCFQSPN